ncbi:MAG: GNAT family N-acetyltransferase [Chloroflexi bacterium]|nr:GNAT family N-acetyltransferase [Chloroflexota bacterium]
MIDTLRIEVKDSQEMAPAEKREIHLFCEEAYGEDLSRLFAVYHPGFHVLARLDDKLISHAMVVTRWLQAGNGPLLRTGYVEMMATAREWRGKGVGRSLMRVLTRAILLDGYELAALCPAETRLYEHLGWEYWRGPLFVRQPRPSATEPARLIATPEERIMIMRLPASPALDLDVDLSVEWRPGGELW